MAGLPFSGGWRYPTPEEVKSFFVSQLAKVTGVAAVGTCAYVCVMRAGMRERGIRGAWDAMVWTIFLSLRQFFLL